MKNFLEFHETIKGKTNEHLPELNCGGCGFFAYYVSKKLAMLGHKPEILVLSSWDDNDGFKNKVKVLNKIKNNIKFTVYENTLSASHFVVKCGRYVFDSNNVIDLENNPLKIGEIIFGAQYIGNYTIEDMVIELYRDRGWNSWYDRINNNWLYQTIKETHLEP